MKQKLPKFSYAVLVWLLCFAVPAPVSANAEDGRVKAALRTIGHEILLNSGDSSSRVLPVEMVENRYQIQFESEFEFDPEMLAATVNEVVTDTRIAKNYLAEVEYCGTHIVAYSFEMNTSLEVGQVACRGRLQPKDCYNIWFTILEEDEAELMANSGSSSLGSDASAFTTPTWLIMALVVLIGALLFFMKKKKEVTPDSNKIQLGQYQFDTRTMELLLGQEKTELSGKEADLLLLLYNAANTTLEKAHILKMVWGDDGDYIGRTLDVFISKLRKKLELDSNIRIVNIRGVGYKLILNV